MNLIPATLWVLLVVLLAGLLLLYASPAQPCFAKLLAAGQREVLVRYVKSIHRHALEIALGIGGTIQETSMHSSSHATNQSLLQVQLDPLGGFKCLLDSYAGLPDCTLQVKGGGRSASPPSTASLAAAMPISSNTTSGGSPSPDFRPAPGPAPAPGPSSSCRVYVQATNGTSPLIQGNLFDNGNTTIGTTFVTRIENTGRCLKLATFGMPIVAAPSQFAQNVAGFPVLCQLYQYDPTEQMLLGAALASAESDVQPGDTALRFRFLEPVQLDDATIYAILLTTGGDGIDFYDSYVTYTLYNGISSFAGGGFLSQENDDDSSMIEGTVLSFQTAVNLVSTLELA